MGKNFLDEYIDTRKHHCHEGINDPDLHVEKVYFLMLHRVRGIQTLLTTKRLMRIPRTSMIPNPLIRLTPAHHSTRPTRSPVILASQIAAHDSSNPVLSALRISFVLSSCSLTRSSMRILASIAIPRDKTIPATPESVSTTPKNLTKANKKNM